MSRTTRVILIAVAVCLLFDLAASFASIAFGFPYARASFGSFLLYFLIGIFAARATEMYPVRQATLTGAIVGLVDATAGWAISWQLGPGRLPATVALTLGTWLGTVLTVTGLAAMLGAIGGLIGRRRPGAQAPAS